MVWSYLRKRHGWLGVVNIFYLPKYRRRLNPNSVKGFVPYLGVVNPTYPWDLSPKGVFGLSHSYLVTFLKCPLPSLLSLFFSLISLVFGLPDLLQLSYKGSKLLLGDSQLFLGIAKKYPLALDLLLSTS